jgi:hypothetical protein
MDFAERASLRLVVGICTVGRPDQVRFAVDNLHRQTRSADTILIAACEPNDVVPFDKEDVDIIFCPRGLTIQRNAVLRHGRTADVVVFFDDDFLPDVNYLQEVENVFLAQPDVVLLTGHVIADGIIGPGLSTAEALRHLEAKHESLMLQEALTDVYNGYGCNMAVRMDVVIAKKLSFDDALPLYAWLEDVDFSRQIAPYGRIARSSKARGVHLGIKSGRQSGVRLGYSQIANPIYMVRKGTFSFWRAVWQIGKNVAMNLIFSTHPEPYIDRRGRLRGNCIGICELLRSKLNPGHANRL